MTVRQKSCKFSKAAHLSLDFQELHLTRQTFTMQALGCLLYFLMFGKLAFQAEAKLQILNGDVIIPPTRPPPLVSLLKELLVVSPLQRPNIVTVLRRLQEVADAMNVDPALLVPRQSQPQPSGELLHLQSLVMKPICSYLMSVEYEQKMTPPHVLEPGQLCLPVKYGPFYKHPFLGFMLS